MATSHPSHMSWTAVVFLTDGLAAGLRTAPTRPAYEATRVLLCIVPAIVFLRHHDGRHCDPLRPAESAG